MTPDELIVWGVFYGILALAVAVFVAPVKRGGRW
jgi:hypothetical protein